MNALQVLVVGHSHIKALIRGWDSLVQQHTGATLSFLSLTEDRFRVTTAQDGRVLNPANPDSVRLDLFVAEFRAAAERADVVAFCLNGNEHNNLGMFKIPGQSVEQVQTLIKTTVYEHQMAWMRELSPHFDGRRVFLYPPPPLEAEDFILKTERVQQLSRVPELREPSERLRFWRLQCETIDAAATTFGCEVVPLPAAVFSPTGFLAQDCYKDISHGNHVFGKRAITALLGHLSTALPGNIRAAPPRVVAMHPYSALPDYMFWKRSVSQAAAGEIDPVVAPPFTIGITDKVATAGSCFAQHISKRLRSGGFHFLVSESPSQAGPEGFHDFSARYGNIYTARQLLQLFDRAFGFYSPLDLVWVDADGRYRDPFRPTIEPAGHATKDSVLADGKRHLAAVQAMFRELDVFVFTLGLTECWTSRLDGAAYPLAPGVACGVYDERKHEFTNFNVSDVVRDLNEFVDKLLLVNPSARIILTVSPVPLAATYVKGQHVLVSTVRSKAVLRVAADEVCSSRQDVYYFPSYEIIMNGNGASSYFEADRRSVTDAGVNHVMRIFMSRLTDAAGQESAKPQKEQQAWSDEIRALNQALCDEEMLDSPAVTPK